MTETIQPQQPSFDGLGIAPALLDALTRAKFTSPTPIQKQAIPLAIEGKDVVGIAQTGTGKTLAFSIPIIQRLQQTRGRALIVLPTRELTLQVEETVEKMARAFGMSTVVLMGGMSMYNQTQKLRRNPRIIVATPGRLLDHMEQRNVNLKDVEIVVLDEADRMFDMGFMPAIKRIFEALPPQNQRQTLLFSATMPPEIMQLAARFMAMPVRVEVVQQGTTAKTITQEIIFVRKDEKTKLLEKVLGEVKGSVLVFSRTKHGAHRITNTLIKSGHSASEIHSDRSLGQRRAALEGFKNGKYRVLVATDIAARGIDVKGIELVINFDLPDASEDYVHRIGRTGRAGMPGHAISFATPDQKSDVRAIERLIRMPLPTKQAPDLSQVHVEEAPREFYEERPRGGDRGGRPQFGGMRREYNDRGGAFQRGGNSRPARPSFHSNDDRPARPAFNNAGAAERPAYQSRPRMAPRPEGVAPASAPAAEARPHRQMRDPQPMTDRPRRAPGPSFARRGRSPGFAVRQKRTIM